MIKYFVVTLILASNSILAQADFFTIIFESEQRYQLHHDILEIDEYIYELKMAQLKAADTIIINGIDTSQYLMKEHNVHNYLSKNEVIIKGYDHDNQPSFIGHKIYNDDGTLDSESMKFLTSYMMPLDYNKQYKYTSDGKLLSVINQLCDTCELKDKLSVIYDSLGLVNEVIIEKPEVGTVHHKRNLLGDTIRYVSHFDLNEKYIKKLSQYGNSIEDLSKEYTDVYLEEETGHTVYKGVRVDNSTGLPVTNWINKRAQNNNIIEFSHFNEGRLVKRRVFEKTDQDMVLSFTDTDKNGQETTYKNELYDAKNYKQKNLKKGSLVYEYDSKGNWINYKDIPIVAKYYRNFKERKYIYR